MMSQIRAAKYLAREAAYFLFTRRRGKANPYRLIWSETCPHSLREEASLSCGHPEVLTRRCADSAMFSEHLLRYGYSQKSESAIFGTYILVNMNLMLLKCRTHPPRDLTDFLILTGFGLACALSLKLCCQAATRARLCAEMRRTR